MISRAAGGAARAAATCCLPSQQLQGPTERCRASGAAAKCRCWAFWLLPAVGGLQRAAFVQQVACIVGSGFSEQSMCQMCGAVHVPRSARLSSQPVLPMQDQGSLRSAETLCQRTIVLGTVGCNANERPWCLLGQSPCCGQVPGRLV